MEEQTVDGATEQPQWGALSTTRPDGTEATPQTECGQAQQPLLSILGGAVTITSNGEERTGSQLYSPRCSRQTSIKQYFHTNNFGSNGEDAREVMTNSDGGGVIEEVKFLEGLI